MFILSCTPRVFIISSTVDKLCGFQLSRVETCQKRSHPGNGFHSRAYANTRFVGRPLWSVFYCDKKYGVKDVSTLQTWNNSNDGLHANLVIVEERKPILTWWQPGCHIWPTEPAVLCSLSSPSWRRYASLFWFVSRAFKVLQKGKFFLHFLFLEGKGLAGWIEMSCLTLLVAWGHDHFLGGKKKHHSQNCEKNLAPNYHVAPLRALGKQRNKHPSARWSAVATADTLKTKCN